MYLGGAASSQARRPVRAESDRASSTESWPATEHSTMIRPGPRISASASSGLRRATTVMARRPKTSSARFEMPNAVNQRSSSNW
jgi:hypothetical protein